MVMVLHIVIVNILRCGLLHQLAVHSLFLQEALPALVLELY